VTPERDRMAERERSRLRRLEMTGTDERRSSRSRSGTPSRGDIFVSQPVFGAPQDLGSQVEPALPLFVYPPQLQRVQTPVMGDDPFRIYVPEHPGIINLNDDDDDDMYMPEMQNASQHQGPLSQEGRYFQWQVPFAPIQPPIHIQPPIAAPPPAQFAAGIRHAARDPHP
jgi:hypothetical protein